MRILVTNDDGIEAPGLHVLARAAAAAGHDVVVAAPAEQSSGSSASIIAADADGRIAITRRTDDAGVRRYAVAGGPGLIALIAARGAFGDPADIVLSGVNHGANVGRAILHSGTVGAALTAGLNGARGLAVSLDVGMNPAVFHWRTAAKIAVRMIPVLQSMPAASVLNLNVPNRDDVTAVREARLAPFGIVQSSLVRGAADHVRLAVEELPNVAEPGTDAALLAAGFATISVVEAVSARPSGLDQRVWDDAVAD